MLEKPFDHKDPKLHEKLPQVEQIIFDKNLVMYFVPSSWLREIVAKGEHPFVQGLVKWIAQAFLENKGILIQKRIAWELINGTLDEKNTFIFSNGDIRVTNFNDKNLSDIIWEDRSLRTDVIGEDK